MGTLDRFVFNIQPRLEAPGSTARWQTEPDTGIPQTVKTPEQRYGIGSRKIGERGNWVAGLMAWHLFMLADGTVRGPLVPKKKTVVLLRWVLIIAFSYLLIIDASTRTVRTSLAIFVVLALVSNLAIGYMPESWTATRVFDFAVVLFDATWVTIGLAWTPHASCDLFLLYFLVIFVAAMGESLGTIVGSAALVSVVYGYMLGFHHRADLQLTATALLRVPFLFVVALFYGYFVTEIRGRRHDAAEADLRARATTELLAAVSHDLRGPLGNAENLL